MIGVAGRGFGFVARIFPKLRRDGGRPSGLAAEITMHQIWSAPVGTRGTIFGSLRKGALHDESGAAVAALEPLPQALEHGTERSRWRVHIVSCPRSDALGR